jgi:hypothetical protein
MGTEMTASRDLVFRPTACSILLLNIKIFTGCEDFSIAAAL